MKLWELDTPSLIIDEAIMLDNIKFVQDFADKHHVNLRPHTKTHKMSELALLQEKYGAKGVAVAKVGEAEVMAASGLKDIFIANEIVGETKWERIRAIMKKGVKLTFGLDSIDQAEQVEASFAKAGMTAQVLVEIEVGEIRSGVNELEEFAGLLDYLEKCTHIQLEGLFSHDGNSYGAKDIAAVRESAVNAQRRTLDFAQLAREKGFPCHIISYGATPTIMNDVEILPGITELRLGTYIFMDASQAEAIGTQKRCAATVLATVMSRPTKDRVILDVGAKGLTMQSRTEGICAVEGRGSMLDYPGVHINNMFDEHAIVYSESFREAVKLGDKVRIIPVHICPVVNLYHEAYLVKGEDVVKTLKIDCQGKLR